MNLLTTTALTVFTANTKAKSAEVNANFSAVKGYLSDFTGDAKHGTIALQSSAKSADYVVTDTDGIFAIEMTTGASARTVTLPTAADNNGRLLLIKKVDSGVGSLTVDGEGTETIDSKLTVVMYNINDSLLIKCNGTGWIILTQVSNQAQNLGTIVASFTLTSEHLRNLKLVANATYTCYLPLTNIKAHEVWEITNAQASDAAAELEILAGGSTSTGLTITSIANGNIALMALQDAPATAAHWKVIRLWDNLAINKSFSFAAGGGTAPGTLTLTMHKNMYTVNVNIPNMTGTTGASSRITSAAAIPTRFRPSAGFTVAARVKNNGSNQAIPGPVEVGSGGNIDIYADHANASFGSTATCGVEAPVCASWIRSSI